MVIIHVVSKLHISMSCLISSDVFPLQYESRRREQDIVSSFVLQNRTGPKQDKHVTFNFLLFYLLLTNFIKIIVLFLNTILYFTLSKQLFTSSNRFTRFLRTLCQKPSVPNYIFKAFLPFSYSALRKSNKKSKNIPEKVSRKSLMEG